MRHLLLAFFAASLAVPAFSQPPRGDGTVAPPSSILTNEDVVYLVKSGLNVDIVTAKIRASHCAFETSPATLSKLKASGVPEAVILEMVRSPAAQPSTESTSSMPPPGHQSRPGGVAGTATTVDTGDKTLTIKSDRGEVTTIQFDENTAFKRLPPCLDIEAATPASAADATDHKVLVLTSSRADENLARSVYIAKWSVQDVKIINAQVRSINVSSNIINATRMRPFDGGDSTTLRQIAISVRPDTKLKRFDSRLAIMIASRLYPNPQQRAANRPTDDLDIGQLIERQPSIAFADLKPGDAIIVMATGGSVDSGLTAIALVAGAEPLLVAAMHESAGPLVGKWKMRDDVDIDCPTEEHCRSRKFLTKI